MLPLKPIKISGTSSGYPNKIIDDKGNEYNYNIDEKGQIVDGYYNLPITGKLLSSIISADKNDTITFTYVEKVQKSYSESDQYTLLDNDSRLNSYNYSTTYAVNSSIRQYGIQRISEIKFRGGKVSFILYPSSDRIKTIEIRNDNNVLLKSIELQSSQLDFPSFTGTEPTYKLDAVLFQTASLETIDKYSFGYNPSYDFSAKDRDFWGFVNWSSSRNTILVPKWNNIQVLFGPGGSSSTQSISIPGGMLNGADRTPNSNAQKGVLNKITYPTGGSTEFTFENNQYYSDKPVRYDAFGREQYKYLPYVPQSGTNISDGTFKKNALSDQQGFYQDVSLNPAANGETIYYGQTEFESSPLNRILKSYAPGNSWAKEGGNKPIEQQYLTNTTADEVRIWDMPASGNIPTSASGRVYGAGALYKNVTKDERGLRKVEFMDKDKRVLLKRVELTPNAADGHANWLSTYYVYDDLGNLRFVISPKAVDLIRPNWVIDANIANGLCFQYTYDSRNRMITKKVPGAEMVEMVYDLRDRLVFTRDGNMRGATDKKWLVTFYDALNRPAMTALYASNATRDALQTSMNTATSNTQPIDYTIPGRANLVLGNYDGVTHLYQATNSIELVDGFDAGTGADIVLEINTGINQGHVSVNATNPLPNIDENALTPLTYTFYDNYSFAGAQAAVSGDFGLPQPGNNNYKEDITGTSSMTKGLVTGTKVKVLGTNDWLTTTTYYNHKGRVIQTVSDNAAGGKDVVTNLYDFSGKLLSSYLRHRNPRSGATAQTTVRTMLSYDAAGRLLTIKKRLNDNPAWERTVADNTYNELGQLQTKRIGINGTGAPLETQSYEYNIRGWLKAMNKGFVNTANSTGNWFGQELSYDYGFTVKQYNGNIAGSKWKSGGDKIARAYGYSYDNASRLTAAEFTQQNTGSTNWTKDQKNFSVSGITYDANGNIGAMMQTGIVGVAAPSNIDQLTYSYESNSNQLSSVTDGVPATSTPGLGDFDNGNTTGADYDYDDNGNLKFDLNKNIAAISYNHLNLPESITVTGKGSIQYQYDALGNKLKKTVVDNTTTPSKTTVTDYIGGFVYQDNVQELVSHEEGRMRPVITNGQLSSYFYDYFLKDHLGNVRTVLTDQPDLTIYTATMETEQAATETALFSNIEETRAVKPVGYPQDETTQQNQYVAKLNAKEGGKKIGPSLVLRVMAGDTIQIGARAFYKSTGPRDNKSVSPEDMVANLIQAFGGAGGARSSHGSGQAENLSPFRNLNGNAYQRLKERNANQNQQDKPKAYLNFVLFDDQFNLVETNSGVRQVKGEPDQLQTLAVDKMPITKSGFLYVYTSNETQQDVLFDNVTVLAASGPLLEETHYYPFGLTMAGISNNVLKGTNYRENRLKFNGKELQSKEFSDGSGLEWHDYGARMYDQQIGRWVAQDKFSEVYNSLTPYHYAANDPVRIVDEGGKLLKDKDGNIIATSTGKFITRDEYPKIGEMEYHYKSTFEVVTIYTDKGTPINALREISTEVTKDDGAGGRIKVTGADNPVSTCSNCHGYSFAGGLVVIEDGTEGSKVINTILKDDGYIVDGIDGQTVSNGDATGFVETNGDMSGIYHSAIANLDGTWSADHGVGMSEENVSKTAAGSPAAKNSLL